MNTQITMQAKLLGIIVILITSTALHAPFFPRRSAPRGFVLGEKKIDRMKRHLDLAAIKREPGTEWCHAQRLLKAGYTKQEVCAMHQRYRLLKQAALPENRKLKLSAEQKKAILERFITGWRDNERRWNSPRTDVAPSQLKVLLNGKARGKTWRDLFLAKADDTAGAQYALNVLIPSR